MQPAIKFCGLTRAADALAAAEAGAAYCGVIFAGGPRLVSAAGANDIFSALPLDVKRVAVVGDVAPHEAAALAEQLALDVLQLHGDPDAESVAKYRPHFGGEIWAVVRAGDGFDRSRLAELFDAADGVLLDAGMKGTRGGTGASFDWTLASAIVPENRIKAKLIVAGGLHAGNVADAIGVLRPDVVDVSSGVESVPGIKDTVRMQQFVHAVSGVGGAA